MTKKPQNMFAADLKSNKINSVPKKPLTSKTTPTIVASDLLIEGELVSSGIIEVEGRIRGTIKGNVVVIRESGLVEGVIIAESLSIRGSFDGKITAENIDISSKAKLLGEVEYGTFSVEDGASVDGTFKKLIKPS